MQNVWIISGGAVGRHTTFEYCPTQAEASARIEALETAARESFEEHDARVDLGVTWEQYQEIQDLLPFGAVEVPHVDSTNSEDDHITPSGEMPTGRIWVVLEDGLPEEGRPFVTTEEEAKDRAWDRNWARWEYYETSEGAATMTFAEYRQTHGGSYDYAPVDPAPVSG